MISKLSAMFRLNLRDVLNGLVVAVLATIYSFLTNELPNHGLHFAQYDWKGMIDLVETATVAYLSKNFFTNSDGKFVGVVKIK